MTVEFLVLVRNGSGSRWFVDILNTGEDEWESIGDLSQAETGGGWTTVPLTITGRDLSNYLNHGYNDEIAVRVYTKNSSQVRSSPAFAGTI